MLAAAEAPPNRMVPKATEAEKRFFLNQYHGAHVFNSSQYSQPPAVINNRAVIGVKD